MSFLARYDGHCNAADCSYGDGKIEAGDECAYKDDEIMHVECAGRERRDESVKTCTYCGTQHRGEC